MNLNPTYSPEVLSLLSAWAARPDALTDLREIFGENHDTSTAILGKIQKGDFSWLPCVEILPAEVLSPAIAAYARETATVYLSDACPWEFRIEALLEEIGHHIDALLNAEETPGDEGALFSATVRGVDLTDEELTSILNEDDSSQILHQGSFLSVECIVTKVQTSPYNSNSKLAPLPPTPPDPPANDSLITGSTQAVTLGSSQHYLIGTLPAGSAAQTLYGNTPSAPAAFNYLKAGNANTTLIAGNALTTSMFGGAGSNCLFGGTGTQTDYFVGGTGNNTIFAANGAATLIGGSNSSTLTQGNYNNYLQAGITGNQSLVGGAGTNLLIGGTGTDTLRSGSGTNTLQSGSATGASSTSTAGLASGASTITLASTSGFSVGNTVMGLGIATGTTITAISGKTITLSSKTISSLASGARISVLGNLLIGGGGTSSSLCASLGNDSLYAASGTNSLFGGIGNDVLSVAGGVNWLESRSSSLVSSGNTLVAGRGQNTLVAGMNALDSLVGVAGIQNAGSSNVFLYNQNNLGSQKLVTDPNSSYDGITNSILLNFDSKKVIDSQFANLSQIGTLQIATVVGATGDLISLGANADNAGIRTLIGGSGNDTLAVSGYTDGVLIDASASQGNGVSIVGGRGLDIITGSAQGADNINGGEGSNVIYINKTNLNLQTINGGSSGLGINNKLILTKNSNSLTGSSFANISNIQTLSLTGGNNTVASLQGSGITNIIGGNGSDVLAATVVSTANAVAASGSYFLQLQSVSGFKVGQLLSGNGIASGTVIKSINAAINTLQLSNPITTSIGKGTTVTAAIDGVTLNAGQSFTAEVINQSFRTTSNYQAGTTTLYIKSSSLSNPSNLFIGQYVSGAGIPAGTTIAKVLYSGNLPTGIVLSQPTTGPLLASTPLTAGFDVGLISGDSLVAMGQNELIIADTAAGANTRLSALYEAGNSTIGNATLVASAFSSNTLVGGAFNNTFAINAQTSSGNGALGSITSASHLSGTGLSTGINTLVLTNLSSTLTDNEFSKVRNTSANGKNTPVIQILRTSSGNNSIVLGKNAEIAGVSSIYGGVGADTISIAGYDAQAPTYINDQQSTGKTSLVGGAGNDTILAGTGNAIIYGGDGNNSLVGGVGTNYISSGVGNSTLDSGLGISSLVGGGGEITYIIRNRFDRILNAGTSDGVDSYVNFDPIQSSQVVQFAPNQPDGSPSITKSISFASQDLSSFYNISNFTVDGGASYNGATYGVGNALDNYILTAGTLSHLVLAMGGNNTIVGVGTGDSLYGYVNSTYANPDLYAAAATNTIDQQFVDGVIGTAGNNSIVANGANSYLDGGPGYADGSGSASGSSTMIGNAAGDTFVVHNVNDSIVAALGRNEMISSANLHSIANNITNVTLLVTKQAPYLPNIDPNNPLLPSNTGQTDPANFLGFGNANPNSVETHGITDGNLVITLSGSANMDIQYGRAGGQQYENDNGVTPTGTGNDGQPFESLSVSGPYIDPNHSASNALMYNLSWSAPTLGGAVVGYDVYYRTDYGLINGAESLGPWLTYVDGTSTDMQGTSANPSVVVDNLPSLQVGQSYDFRVTAQQITMPTMTDPDTGLVTGTPVTLQGSNGNDVLWAFMPAESLFGGYNVGYDNNAPNLSNNFGSVVDPNGNPIPNIPVGNQPTLVGVDSYPVSLDGGNGNNVMITRAIGYGDGSDYTVGGITYGGLNTLQGDIGSDTFFVSNGGNGSDFDHVIKYGLETPVNYANFAPSAPTQIQGGVSISKAGVSLNGGQHNLVIANHISQPVATLINPVAIGDTSLTIQSFYGNFANDPANGFYVGEQLEFKNTPFSYAGHITGISYDGAGNAILSLSSPVTETLAAFNNVQGVSGVTLSSTVVEQGKFIDELCINGHTNFGEGNALNNFVYDINNGEGGNTLVGNVGQDSVIGTGSGDLLIGGTATGLDSISGALADAYAGLTSSNFRDTDPNPNNPGGPGSADPSQYWVLNGRLGGYVYNYNANMDTLVSTIGTLAAAATTLDGGAGADSMVGSSGDDLFVVSSAGTLRGGAGGLTNITNDTLINYSDGYSASTVSGANALNSDVVTGNTGNDTVLFTGSDVYWSGFSGATTATLGYALGGTANISNIVLQMGDPIALAATGNTISAGIANQQGSNMLVGNEYNNTLDGKGIGIAGGVDTLIGHGGTDYFNVPSVAYTTASADANAAYDYASTSGTTSSLSSAYGYTVSNGQYATDNDWALIQDFTNGFQVGDTLSGVGIAAGTTIADLTLLPGTNGQYQVSLSAATTAAMNGGTIITDTLSGPTTTLSNTYNTGTKVIQVTDNSKFAVGEAVTLTGATGNTLGDTIAGMNLTTSVIGGQAVTTRLQVASINGLAANQTISGGAINGNATIQSILPSDTTKLSYSGDTLNYDLSSIGIDSNGNSIYRSATLYGSNLGVFSNDVNMILTGAGLKGGTQITGFTPSANPSGASSLSLYNDQGINLNLSNSSSFISVNNIVSLSAATSNPTIGGSITVGNSVILTDVLKNGIASGAATITGAVTQTRTTAPIAGTPSSTQVAAGATTLTLGGRGSDVLQLPSAASINKNDVYLIGSAPNGYGQNNMNGAPNANGVYNSLIDLVGNPSVDQNSTDFGIYLYNTTGSSAPNLVAEIKGISMANFLSVNGTSQTPTLYSYTRNISGNYVTTNVNGQSSDATNPSSYALGGVTSNAGTDTASQLVAKNFLGMGAFYTMPAGNTTHILFPEKML